MKLQGRETTSGATLGIKPIPGPLLGVGCHCLNQWLQKCFPSTLRKSQPQISAKSTPLKATPPNLCCLVKSTLPTSESNSCTRSRTRDSRQISCQKASNLIRRLCMTPRHPSLSLGLHLRSSLLTTSPKVD